jgi:hypothetical protein
MSVTAYQIFYAQGAPGLGWTFSYADATAALTAANLQVASITNID